MWYRDGTVAVQEWVVVKSRVERELATAVAHVAAESERSVSYVIRAILMSDPAVKDELSKLVTP